MNAGDPQIREANTHATSMWLLKEGGGQIQVEEQQCRLLSDEERVEFQAIHLDCSSVCRGRCGFTDGLPRQPVTTGQGEDDSDCLCVFRGASQCWVPSCAQRAPAPTGASPRPAKGNTSAKAGKVGGGKQGKPIQPEAYKPNAEEPSRDEQQIEPERQGERQGDPSALQLAPSKYAPITRFTSQQAEEMLEYLTTSAMREKIIARAVENISLTDTGFATKIAQHSSGRRVTPALLIAIARPLILQCREQGHAHKATTTIVFSKMSERISAELQVFTREDGYKKQEARGKVVMEPLAGCSTW